MEFPEEKKNSAFPGIEPLFFNRGSIPVGGR
jgi:hypothetical protein